MQIKSFSVKNFRSITKTTELPLHNMSILIGPNNEGKSNILQAFWQALSIFSEPVRIAKIVKKNGISCVKKMSLKSLKSAVKYIESQLTPSRAV